MEGELVGVIHGVFLVQSLQNVYVLQVANPAEFLQLLINFDLLQEATSLALEYLDAVMGHGKEYFGIEVNLIVHSCKVLLYTTCTMYVRMFLSRRAW